MTQEGECDDALALVFKANPPGYVLYVSGCVLRMFTYPDTRHCCDIEMFHVVMVGRSM